MYKILTLTYLVMLGLSGYAVKRISHTSDFALHPDYKVNKAIERKPIPKTPHDMNFPNFAQAQDVIS